MNYSRPTPNSVSHLAIASQPRRYSLTTQCSPVILPIPHIPPHRNEHEFSGHRVRDRISFVNVTIIVRAAVPRGVRIPHGTIVAVAASFQDQFQCPRYSEARGPAGHWQRLWRVTKVIVRPVMLQPPLGSHYSSRLAHSRHDLTETTRAMAKRGSEDLKKLAALQATLVSIYHSAWYCHTKAARE